MSSERRSFAIPVAYRADASQAMVWDGHRWRDVVDALADERAHADRLAEALADPADDDAARAHRALLVALHAHRRAGEP